MRTILAVILISLMLTSCKRGYEPIAYGKDACAHCKMTIVDARYASELVTAKGRADKFDDMSCMKRYIAEQGSETGSQYFIQQHSGTNSEPLRADKAVYLQHESFESPMNGNYAAFATIAEAKPFMNRLKIPNLSWEDIK